MKWRVKDGKILKDGKFYSKGEVIEFTKNQAKEFLDSGKIETFSADKSGEESASDEDADEEAVDEKN